MSWPRVTLRQIRAENNYYHWQFLLGSIDNSCWVFRGIRSSLLFCRQDFPKLGNIIHIGNSHNMLQGVERKPLMFTNFNESNHGISKYQFQRQFAFLFFRPLPGWYINFVTFPFQFNGNITAALEWLAFSIEWLVFSVTLMAILLRFRVYFTISKASFSCHGTK